MSDFFPARGCMFIVPSLNAGTSKGFYGLEGLTTGPIGKNNSIVLLQGVDYMDTDIIAPVVTLENTKILYTFGSNFGNISIIGEILVGPAGWLTTGSRDVQNYFNEKRVSKKKEPVTLSMNGSKYLSVFLQGLRIGTMSPDTHVQPFAFIGIVAEN